jgi:hypothetical protein
MTTVARVKVCEGVKGEGGVKVVRRRVVTVVKVVRRRVVTVVKVVKVVNMVRVKVEGCRRRGRRWRTWQSKYRWRKLCAHFCHTVGCRQLYVSKRQF